MKKFEVILLLFPGTQTKKVLVSASSAVEACSIAEHSHPGFLASEANIQPASNPRQS